MLSAVEAWYSENLKMDSKEFTFNAPQFIDLTAADNEDENKTTLESYFGKKNRDFLRIYFK